MITIKHIPPEKEAQRALEIIHLLGISAVCKKDPPCKEYPGPVCRACAARMIMGQEG
jgi:hypothetical protein